MTDASTATRLQRALEWHRRLHAPERLGHDAAQQLRRLQEWQRQRLAGSFSHWLADAQSRPAAEFFLSDLYAPGKTRERDESAYRVVPSLRRWLPAKLEPLLADAFLLGALSGALDERVAAAMPAGSAEWRVADYASAYRQAGCFRARRLQIDLIAQIGLGLSRYARKPGVYALLLASRLPARLAGAASLQDFLERGYAAFVALPSAEAFIDDIVSHEREVRRRLIAGESDPFPR